MYQILNTKDFKEKLENSPDGVLLDVRSQMEFEAGHIPKAKNLDAMSASFLEEIRTLDKEKPVLVYCRSGSRSSFACQTMDSMGFEAIYELENGIVEWDEPLEN